MALTTEATRSKINPGANWNILGFKAIDYKSVKDVIIPKYPDKEVTAIRLSVSGGEVNIHHCVIHFVNGEKQTVHLRKIYRPSMNGKVIDLKGGKRKIASLTYHYRPDLLNKSKTHIEMWGRTITDSASDSEN